jgi:hypothetical protein
MAKRQRKAMARHRLKPGIRASGSISRGIMRSLRKIGQPKGRRSWEAVVGYDTPTLRAHLERQWKRGMTWDNYGKAWHIDHIVPVSAFAITGPDCPELRACWALSNLRPLWAEANMKKSARRLTLL